MRSALQHTLLTPVVLEGRGVHGGARVRLALRPAPAGAGVTFVRADVVDRDNRIAPGPHAVVGTRLHTELGNAADVRVATVEHLMAALVATGLDNVIVEIDGVELPIMDGSAAPFVTAIHRAGLRAQSVARDFLEILEPIEVGEGDKRAALLPAADFEGLAIDVEIAFASAAIGRQRLTIELDAASFARELAPARSFGFVEEVETLRAEGLAQGGDLSNVIVIEGDRVVNPEGLRFPDEFVRHKALDAVGDLFVLGAPLIGRYRAYAPGHALNNALARAVAARPGAWRLRRRQPERVLATG